MCCPNATSIERLTLRGVAAPAYVARPDDPDLWEHSATLAQAVALPSHVGLLPTAAGLACAGPAARGRGGRWWFGRLVGARVHRRLRALSGGLRRGRV